MQLTLLILNLAMIWFLLRPYFDMGAHRIHGRGLLLVSLGIVALNFNILIYLEVVPSQTRIITTFFVCLASWCWWKECEEKLFFWGSIIFAELAVTKLYSYFIQPNIFHTYNALFVSKTIIYCMG